MWSRSSLLAHILWLTAKINPRSFILNWIYSKLHYINTMERMKTQTLLVTSQFLFGIYRGSLWLSEPEEDENWVLQLASVWTKMEWIRTKYLPRLLPLSHGFKNGSSCMVALPCALSACYLLWDRVVLNLVPLLWQQLVQTVKQT